MVSIMSRLVYHIVDTTFTIFTRHYHYSPHTILPYTLYWHHVPSLHLNLN